MNIFTDKRWLLLATATLALVGIAHPAVAQTITEFPLSERRQLPPAVSRPAPTGNRVVCRPKSHSV